MKRGSDDFLLLGIQPLDIDGICSDEPSCALGNTVQHLFGRLAVGQAGKKFPEYAFVFVRFFTFPGKNVNCDDRRSAY